MLPTASVQYVAQQMSNRNGISAIPIFSAINVKKDGISMGKSKVLLSIESLQEITNYAHWIPITQGLHLSYFDKHFPGWEWNDFVPRLIEVAGKFDGYSEAWTKDSFHMTSLKELMDKVRDFDA